MKSTRSLLILYFLLLVALSLGAIGILADRVISQTLAEKAQAAGDAIDLRTDRAIQVAREKFDAELNHDARLVAQNAAKGRYQADVERERERFPLMTMHLPLLGSVGPQNAYFAPLWHASLNNALNRRSTGPLVATMQGGYVKNLKLDQKFVDQLATEDSNSEFIQMDSSLGSRRRSANLMAAGYTLPFDQKDYANRLDDSFYDNVPLPNGLVVRRVILKTPILFMSGFTRFPNMPGRIGRPPEQRGPDMRRPPEPPQPVVPDQLPAIYVHVAKSDLEVQEKVAEIRAKAQEEKDEQDRSNEKTKGILRFVLGSATLLTFLASILGSSWLVRRGLKPLNQLSDAVSQVSERDFRLTMDRRELTTELQPIHARITETLEQLKSAFDREKQAVADISHELRTPVASLLATIDVSLRKPRTVEQYRETLTDCRGITKQLGQLVEKVMTLAYFDAGQTKMSLLELDVTEIAMGCAAVIRPLAHAHGLTFELLQTEPLEMTTDPDRLREILTNLLHNAIEYNRPGGHIELSMVETPSQVAFHVRDTGIGMTQDVSEHIFERFYRADSSRTATGVHAGLGLAIVKEYVRCLGGTIHVESEPDIGSTFTVTLPRNGPSE